LSWAFSYALGIERVPGKNMSLFCCDGGACLHSARMRTDASGPAPIVPDNSQTRSQQSLPMLQDWDKQHKISHKLSQIVNQEAPEIAFKMYQMLL